MTKPVLLGAGILACTLAALSLHLPGSIWAGTLARKDGVVGLMLVSAGLYGLAVALVRRRAVDWRVVIGVAVALRLVLLASPPFMSSDVYRYVWDGRVQAAGINPYVYIPADPALAGLRDDRIYPRINRADYAPTIYPPMAQVIFHAVATISQSVFAVKFVMVLLETAGMAAMWRLLVLAGLPPSRLLIYAWNPLAAWAVAGEGHIDGAAIGLLGLAMLAAATRRRGLAGVLLGGAILTKFLPLAAAPALWHRWDWKTPLLCALTIAALYAIYLDAGLLVLGFLGHYTREEGLHRGSGFWLLGLLGRSVALPPWTTVLYLGVCALVLATAAYRASAASGIVAMGRGVAVLAALTLAALSPHYPWYYAWLALPCCLWGTRATIYLSVAPILLYWDPFHAEIIFPSLVFIPAGLLACYDAVTPLVGVRSADHA